MLRNLVFGFIAGPLLLLAIAYGIDHPLTVLAWLVAGIVLFAGIVWLSIEAGVPRIDDATATGSDDPPPSAFVPDRHDAAPAQRRMFTIPLTRLPTRPARSMPRKAE